MLTVAARVARRWFAELHHLRCCALILSYMTERIMTFVVCVQRVLKEGIISGNFSLLQQGIFL